MNKYADQPNHRHPGRTAETWNSQSKEKIKDSGSSVGSHNELSPPEYSVHNRLAASMEENVFTEMNKLCLQGLWANS